MTTEKQGDTAALETEAAELKQDIKETETEAAAERTAGNDARADRLEASLADARKELAELKDMIKAQGARSFAPAPGDGEPPAAAAGEEKKTEGSEATGAPEAEGKPKKRHWMFGDRWNQE